MLELFFGLLGLALFLWFVIAPILGLLGYLRSKRLEEELAQLRSQLSLKPSSSISSSSEEPAVQSTAAPPAAPAPKYRDDIPAGPYSSERQTASSSDTTRPSVSHPTSKGPNWEHLIAANWMIWAGGLALAMGALFLVRATIEAGYFGPAVRTISAAAMGLMMIAASWRAKNWVLVAEGQGAMMHLPSILAGGGVIALYGACLAAGVLYGFAPPTIILAGFVLISFGAVLLSLIYGSVLAAIGLIGAYISPFFTGAEGGSPLVLLPYAAAVTAAGLMLISWRSWRFLTWITLAGSMFWGVANLNISEDAAVWAVPTYAVSLVLIATIFAWNRAGPPLKAFVSFKQIAQELKNRGETLISAYIFWVGGGALLAVSLLDSQVELFALAGMSVYAGLGLLTASRREGFSLLAPISAAVVMTTLALWPDWSQAHTAFILAVGIGFGAVGLALIPKVAVKTPIAATSALAPPVGLFLAFWRGGDLEQSLLWGLGGLIVAMLMISVLEMMRRSQDGFEHQAGAAAAYALGAILSIALAPFLAMSELWLGTSAAVSALAIALTHSRFEFPILRNCGVAITAAAVFLLIRPGMLNSADISSTPVFNELSASFGLAVLAVGVGGFMLSRFRTHSNAYYSAAGILGFALVGLLIRHWAGGGTLSGPFGGYAEASGYAIAYLGAALSLIWRLGSRRGVLLRLVEYLAAAIGVGGVVAAITAISWDEALGAPLLNLLLIAFAMPAILLGGCAVSLRRNNRLAESELFGLAAMLTGLLWTTTETRRLFEGLVLGSAGFTDLSGREMWAYSAAWLVFAIGLLAWGVWRGLASVRYASLGLFMLTIVKVFLFDLSTTDGVWRAVSFIGLGVTLLGVALFYQKFIFKQPAKTTSAGGEEPA